MTILGHARRELISFPSKRARSGMGEPLTEWDGLTWRWDRAQLNQMKQKLGLLSRTSSSDSCRRARGNTGLHQVTFHHSGALPDQAGIYVASGLGSSGLHNRPLIGWHLAQLGGRRKPTLGSKEIIQLNNMWRSRAGDKSPQPPLNYFWIVEQDGGWVVTTRILISLQPQLIVDRDDEIEF